MDLNQTSQTSYSWATEWLGFERRGFKGQGHKKYFPKIWSTTAKAYRPTVRRPLLSSLWLNRQTFRRRWWKLFRTMPRSSTRLTCYLRFKLLLRKRLLFSKSIPMHYTQCKESATTRTGHSRTEVTVLPSKYFFWIYLKRIFFLHAYTAESDEKM